MGLAFRNVISFSKLLSLHSLNLTLNHVLNMLSPLNYISFSCHSVSLLPFNFFFPLHSAVLLPFKNEISIHFGNYHILLLTLVCPYLFC